MALAACLASALATGCGSSPGTGSGGDGGGVVLDGSVIVVAGNVTCPGISSFSIEPAELAIGQPAQLAIQTVGSTPTGIQWSAEPATVGTFSRPTSGARPRACVPSHKKRKGAGFPAPSRSPN